MEYYFAIRNDEGDTYVDVLTKEELLARLSEGYYGSIGFLTENDVKDDRNTQYWGDGLLIIKGHIVLPVPQITQYYVE